MTANNKDLFIIDLAAIRPIKNIAPSNRWMNRSEMSRDSNFKIWDVQDPKIKIKQTKGLQPLVNRTLLRRGSTGIVENEQGIQQRQLKSFRFQQFINKRRGSQEMVQELPSNETTGNARHVGDLSSFAKEFSVEEQPQNSCRQRSIVPPFGRNSNVFHTEERKATTKQGFRGGRTFGLLEPIPQTQNKQFEYKNTHTQSFSRAKEPSLESKNKFSETLYGFSSTRQSKNEQTPLKHMISFNHSNQSTGLRTGRLITVEPNGTSATDGNRLAKIQQQYPESVQASLAKQIDPNSYTFQLIGKLRKKQKLNQINQKKEIEAQFHQSDFDINQFDKTYRKMSLVHQSGIETEPILIDPIDDACVNFNLKFEQSKISNRIKLNQLKGSTQIPGLQLNIDTNRFSSNGTNQFNSPGKSINNQSTIRSFQESSFINISTERGGQTRKKQEVGFDNQEIQIGAENIGQVPEIKVEEPQIKKALDLLGNIKAQASGTADAQKPGKVAVKGVEFQNKLKQQEAQDTWEFLTNKTKNKIKEIKERQADEHLINQTPADLVKMLDKKIHQRKRSQKVEIISEAALQGFDLDTYPQDVEEFIQARLKSQFWGKDFSRVYQKLYSNANTCQIHNLYRMGKFNYDELGKETRPRFSPKKFVSKRTLKTTERSRSRSKSKGKSRLGSLKRIPVQKISKRNLTFGQKNNQQIDKKEVMPQVKKQIPKVSKVQQEVKIEMFKKQMSATAVCDHSGYQSIPIRQQYFDQYKYFRRFQAQLKEQLKHLKKTRILELLSVNFNLQDLSRKEEEILGNYEQLSKLIMAPLRYILKHEDMAQVPDQIQKPLEIEEYDNQDQAMYNFQYDHDNETRHNLVVTHQAQNYLETVQVFLKSTQEQPQATIEEPKRVSDLERFRSYLLFEPQNVKVDIQVESSGGKMELHDRIAQYKVKHQYDKPSTLEISLSFNQFIEQTQSYLGRFLKEILDNHSFKYFKDRMPMNITTPQNQRPRLSQAQTDIIESQKYQYQMFASKVAEKEFFAFVKQYQNEITRNEEEENLEKVLKEFINMHATPRAVNALISNQSLQLIDLSVSAAEAKILGLYLKWSKESKNVKNVKIVNCQMKESNIVPIFKGLQAQQRLIKLHIQNQVITQNLMDCILSILSRPIENSLQELALVDVKNVQASVMVSLFYHLWAEDTFLSKLKLSNFEVFESRNDENGEDSFYYLKQYLIEITELRDYNQSIQLLTHLDLSSSNLSPKQLCSITQILEDNTTLQFLNLSSNLKLGNLESQFLEKIEGMLQTNIKSLTHLDISNLFENPLVLSNVFNSIMSYSKSLQVLHFSCHENYQSEIIQLCQMAGVQQFPVDKDQYLLSWSDQRKLEFIQRAQVDHLLLPSTRLELNVNSEIQKKIRSNQTPKMEEMKDSNIDNYQFARDLNMDAKDWKYIEKQGVFYPYLDAGQSNSRWQITSNCKYCENLQSISIYFDDIYPTSNGYAAIENPHVTQLLRKFYLPGEPRETPVEAPLLLGSVTKWKPYQMIPTYLHTFNVLRELVLKVQFHEDDLLTEQLINQGLDLIISKKDQSQLEKLAGILPDYPKYLDYAQTETRFEQMRNTNEFCRPRMDADYSMENFLAQVKATPGKQSVIIYSPKSDKFYCKNILVEVQIQALDLPPRQTLYRSQFDQNRFDFFASENIVKTKIHNMQFLTEIQRMQKQYPFENYKYLYDHYFEINDEFLLEAAKNPNFYPKAVLHEELMLSRKQYIDYVFQSGESARIHNNKTKYTNEEFSNHETKYWLVQNMAVLKEIFKQYTPNSDLIELQDLKVLLRVDIEDLIMLRAQIGFCAGHTLDLDEQDIEEKHFQNVNDSFDSEGSFVFNAKKIAMKEKKRANEKLLDDKPDLETAFYKINFQEFLKILIIYVEREIQAKESAHKIMKQTILISPMSEQCRQETGESGSVTPVSPTRADERGSRLKPFWKQALEVLQEIVYKDFQPKPTSVEEVKEELPSKKSKKSPKAPKKKAKKAVQAEKVGFGTNLFDQLLALKINQVPPESEPADHKQPFDPHNLDLVENQEIQSSFLAYCQTFNPVEPKKKVIKKKIKIIC